MSTHQAGTSAELSPAEIRDFRETDVEGVLPLLHQLWPDARADDEAMRAALQRGCSTNASRFICATVGGDIVGFCTLSIRESLWQQGLLGHVDELVVNDKHRGKGIGTQLLQRIEQVARELGCRRIELDSAFHRTQAHGFYERMGYTKRALMFSKTVGADR